MAPRLGAPQAAEGREAGGPAQQPGCGGRSVGNGVFSDPREMSCLDPKHTRAEEDAVCTLAPRRDLGVARLRTKPGLPVSCLCPWGRNATFGQSCAGRSLPPLRLLRPLPSAVLFQAWNSPGRFTV